MKLQTLDNSRQAFVRLPRKLQTLSVALIVVLLACGLADLLFDSGLARTLGGSILTTCLLLCAVLSTVQTAKKMWLR